MRLTKRAPQIVIGTSTFGGDADWLDRAAFGQKLSNLVDALDSPTVIALDGEWGSGKSHFLKLWVGAHKHQFNGHAEVVYFDAFKEDFLDDPLISLVAAIAPVTEPEGKLAQAGKTLRRLALPLAKGGARIGLAVASYGATAVAEGVWDSVALAAGGEAQKVVDDIDKLWAQEASKRAAMEAFQNTLRTLVETSAEGAPAQKLVIIIDELDRCRPDYALSLLETIKHFFAVDGVHFVLGVNLSELENSVKARYGAGCDATMYLRKFITLLAHLPDLQDWAGKVITVPAYAEKLAESYDFEGDIAKAFVGWIEARNSKKPLTLREIGRCAQRFALVAPGLANKRSDWVDAVTAVTIVDVVEPELGKRLRRQDFSGVSLNSCFSGGVRGGGRAKMLSRLTTADRDTRAEGDYALSKYNKDALRQIYTDYIDTWLPIKS